jgi:predicted MFS family arabinose efflux permease
MTTQTSPSRINPWLVVWLCFAALAIVLSARQSVAIMTVEWSRALGWSKTFIGSGQSVVLVVIAVVAPVTGHYVDRHGVRALLTGGLLVVATSLALFAVYPVAAVYILGYGLIGGLGFAATNDHVISTAIARVFHDRRGLAIGIATSGSTAGQFIFVPLVTLGMAYFSWRWSIAATALACAVLAAVIWTTLGSSQSAVIHQNETPEQEPLTGRLKFLATSPTFHILYWSYFICGITTTGAIETHFLPYAAFCGFPPIPASGIYGFTMAVNFGGMLLSGYLTDRVNRPLLLGSIYIMRAFSFIVLMNVGTSYEMMILFAVIFGIFDYSTVPPTASLAASHLGLKIMGLAMGLISGGHALGGAVGAFFGGYLFDLFARYTEMWWAAFATAILAGLMVFLLREKREEQGVLAAA